MQYHQKPCQHQMLYFHRFDGRRVLSSLGFPFCQLKVKGPMGLVGPRNWDLLTGHVLRTEDIYPKVNRRWLEGGRGATHSRWFELAEAALRSLGMQMGKDILATN